jgi:hypothetical protein
VSGKGALRDPEGGIALDVLRHLLGARPLTPERFPLTEQTLQAVACRLGHVLGQKRCRRMVKRLATSGVVASLRESVLSASTRLSRPIFARGGGSIRDILGLPPPEIPRRDVRRMKSLDEVFHSPRSRLL